jgi:hypothetical protein
MGYLSGDRLEWHRWWLPFGEDVTLWEGLLPDPDRDYLRYLNKNLIRLSDSADRRARILLADRGMGKSTELEQEVARLRSAGAHVELVDLGTFATGHEVKLAIEDVVQRWQEAGADELVLALDGFDEPLVDIGNLSDLLIRALGALDHERLRVIVASRSSLWRQSLLTAFSSWWGQDQTVVLELAPLTDTDIAMAAESEGGEGTAFLDAVRAAGAGPLAAQPITLRLMLSAAKSGALPGRQLEVYQRGVAGLAEEVAPRRIERRRTGAVLPKRLRAASRLAAVSLLSGRPSIVQIGSSSQDSTQLALDELADDRVTAEELLDVWDSALMKGDDQARTWCHHSVAEYLCAAELANLPPDTVMSLLAAPDQPGRLLPQLEETAAWVATMSADAFDRLVEQRPELLLNPDLRGRPPEDRMRVGKAVIAQLTAGRVISDRSAFDALAYPGVEEDLRPLLAPDQPSWLRREAVRMVAATETRALDAHLLALVEAVAGAPDAEYTAEMQLSGMAANALRGCTQQAVVVRLHSLLGDAFTPATVRAGIVESLFPAQLSVSQLLTLVAPQDRFRQPFGRMVLYTLQRAVKSGRVTAADLLEWFRALPPSGDNDPRARALAATAARDVLTAESAGSARWENAVSVISGLLRGAGSLREWTAPDVTALGPTLRRQLTQKLTEGKNDESLVGTLIERELIRREDLTWWLDRLQDGLTGSGDRGLSAGAVVRQLAWEILDHDQLLAVARNRCQANDALGTVGAQEFEPAVVAMRRDQRAKQQRLHAKRLAEQAEREFSPGRLDIALAAGDLISVLGELRKDPSREQRPPGPTGPIAAWSMLGSDFRVAVASLAVDHLSADELDLTDHEVVYDLMEALEIVTTVEPSRLDGVPADRWFEWLPALLRSPGGYGAAQICLHRAQALDPQRAGKILCDRLEEQVGSHMHLGARLSSTLPSGVLETLADRALGHARDPAVNVDSLAGLLDIAGRGRPHETAQVALEHLRRCPSTPPPAGVRDRNDPALASWMRAVDAARALMVTMALCEVFDELLATFASVPALAIEAVRGLDAGQTWSVWKSLEADQLAQLYLWAKRNIQVRRHGPGVVVHTDRAEELSNDVLSILISRGDEDAVAALEDLADKTSNVWLKHEAAQIGAALIASSARRPSPRAVLTVLADPHKRAVTTTSQLAEVILDELGRFGQDLLRNRALRRRLWQKQRPGTNWDGTYVPVEENHLSDELKLELEQRLKGRVAMLREVQIQSRLSTTSGDFPDLLSVVLSTDESTMSLPIEVKGNWHEDVVTALSTQLADRYLDGPLGTEGIYVVGFFYGDKWAPTDTRRRAQASRRTREELEIELQGAAERVRDRGRTVHVRVLDIPLDIDSTTAVPGMKAALAKKGAPAKKAPASKTAAENARAMATSKRASPASKVARSTKSSADNSVPAPKAAPAQKVASATKPPAKKFTKEQE